MHNEPYITTTILDAIGTMRGGTLSARGVAQHVAPKLPGVPIGYLIVKAALALKLLFEMPDPADFTDTDNQPLHGLTEPEAFEALRYSGEACGHHAAGLRAELALRVARGT
jgi:hypothetical protein